jgi:GIY-YIG catalytic domain
MRRSCPKDPLEKPFPDENRGRGSNPFLSAFAQRSLKHSWAFSLGFGGQVRFYYSLDNAIFFHFKAGISMFYVYILRCADDTYYTGCTEDLKERFVRHQKGYVDSRKK